MEFLEYKKHSRKSYFRINGNQKKQSLNKVCNHRQSCHPNQANDITHKFTYDSTLKNFANLVATQKGIEKNKLY